MRIDPKDLRSERTSAVQTNLLGEAEGQDALTDHIPRGGKGEDGYGLSTVVETSNQRDS